MSLSTHVLDAVTGRPAEGVAVSLSSEDGDRWQVVAQGTTDADGRVRTLGTPQAGVHRITFATGEWFEARGVAAFYPQVQITFRVVDAAAHHHVPLLLSPYAYSTYRGS